MASTNKMDPLAGKGTLKYDNKSIEVKNMRMVMHQNLFFDKSEFKWYSHFNRYGFIDPYHHDQVIREFLFFTKPDLFIFNVDDINNIRGNSAVDVLNPNLINYPFFRDAATRNMNALAQLQYSVKDENGRYNPFMSLLTNCVTGKMDLPSLQAESQQSTPNIYGVTIDYRSHSMKSDTAYDFSLSFTDTAYLEIYTMVKAYDEFLRLQKLGSIDFIGNNRAMEDMYKVHPLSETLRAKYKEYLESRIIPEQFSVYKFLIGSDGETILYYAKATGVFFVDVPRNDFSDPGNNGFNYSLSFHANFVEDSNPLILAEFNSITPADTSGYNDIDVFNGMGVNNSWARYPYIQTVYSSTDKRVQRRGVNKDYRLKWTDADNGDDDNISSGAVSSLQTQNVRDSVTKDSNTSNYVRNPNYYNSGLRISPARQAGNLIYNMNESGLPTTVSEFRLFTS